MRTRIMRVAGDDHTGGRLRAVNGKAGEEAAGVGDGEGAAGAQEGSQSGYRYPGRADDCGHPSDRRESAGVGLLRPHAGDLSANGEVA